MWDTVIAKCPISSECPITRSNTLLPIARSRESGTIAGSVLLGTVDAITLSFLIVLMILMNAEYVDM